jgi:23S rRNA (guanosine2251-2'-O)-methyltransferase
MSLRLKNPHSVLAALEQRPADVIEVRLSPKGASQAWEDVERLARERGVTLKTAHRRQERERRRRRDKDDGKSGREGAAEALVKEAPGVSLGEMFGDAPERAGGRGLWLALDCLQDPHNLGAIFRSAAFFGVRGVVMTLDRAAPLSAVAYDVSAGGVEHVPFSIQTNLSRTLDYAKEAGVWVLGASEHASDDVSQIPRDRAWLLVIGNESHGLRRLTLEKCDSTCRLSPRGGVTSLNASVAAGVLMSILA